MFRYLKRSPARTRNASVCPKLTEQKQDLRFSCCDSVYQSRSIVFILHIDARAGLAQLYYSEFSLGVDSVHQGCLAIFILNVDVCASFT